MKDAYRILVGKPEWKEPLWRCRRSGRIILKSILKKCLFELKHSWKSGEWLIQHDHALDQLVP